MRNHRIKFDWSKPFKLIDNKKAFDELQVTEEIYPTSSMEEKKQNSHTQKQQIIIPKIETVKRITEVKPFAKITPNYIRLPAHLNVPKPNAYQLTQVDHFFLEGHKSKYTYEGKNILTQQFLSKAIIELETRAGRDSVIPRGKGWLMTFIQKENRDLINMPNFDQFADALYNYWKNRRQELKFPLYRPLWRPNPDEYNHMLAFKLRQRQKRNLRRANRVIQDEIVFDLEQQFEIASMICERISQRQQLKLRTAQVQIANFYNQAKNFVNPKDYQFIGQLMPQIRNKDKQKLKALQNGLEGYKLKRQSNLNEIKFQSTQNNFDKKQSLINFLATVVSEAETVGISYDKIFNPNITSLSNNNKVDQKCQLTVANATVPIGIIQSETKEVPNEPIVNEEYLKISIRRDDDMLLRGFEDDIKEQDQKSICKDYLDYKATKISSLYFGNDDDTDYKDYKKYVSANFKKYIQQHGSGNQK